MFVHAHPDDETLWGGALMAALAERGARVVLVTSNRGELGQVVDPALAELFGTDGLGPRRVQERGEALAVLGIDEAHWLGSGEARSDAHEDREYRDSGMSWISEGVAGPDPVAAADPRSFTSIPFAEALADLDALVARVRPDAIVTYDAHGGYGHPDHVRAHEIAVAAGRDAGVPVFELTHPETPAETAEGVLWFALPAYTDRIREAMRHYRTQVVVGEDGWIQHDSGFRHPVPVGVGLVRHVDAA
nr:PIG-L family deacetylase [Pseudoclavibacter chungangensis]